MTVSPGLGAATANGEPVDFRAVASMLAEDDEAELRSVVIEYIATADPTFGRARTALGQHDPVALKEVSHAGKGSTLNIAQAAAIYLNELEGGCAN